MSVDWTTIEDAIVAWVRAGSGLAAGKVYWSQQEGGRPAGASIALRLSGLRPSGHDWSTIVVDEDADPGEEIRTYVRGSRRATLSMQAFPPSPGPGAPVSPSAAIALLSGIVSARYLPSRIATLAAAGVGVLSFGPIQSIDGILGVSFEPRATLDAQLSLAAEVSEASTYIETVEITDELTGDEFVVP